MRRGQPTDMECVLLPRRGQEIFCARGTEEASPILIGERTPVLRRGAAAVFALTKAPHLNVWLTIRGWPFLAELLRRLAALVEHETAIGRAEMKPHDAEQHAAVLVAIDEACDGDLVGAPLRVDALVVTASLAVGIVRLRWWLAAQFLNRLL